MKTALTSIWTDCKLLVGTLGIIGIAIGAALLASAEEEVDDVGGDAPKKENAGLKYTGLAILLISICAVGVKRSVAKSSTTGTLEISNPPLRFKCPKDSCASGNTLQVRRCGM